MTIIRKGEVKMDIKKFKIINPNPFEPQMQILEMSIIMNRDVNIWHEGNYITVRINDEDKQIAIVREKGHIPNEGFRAEPKKNGKELHIENESIVRAIRSTFGKKKGILNLDGVIDGDAIIFSMKKASAGNKLSRIFGM